MEGPPLAELLPIAMLLLSLRTQLTSLQSLSLELSQSWADADLAFGELASMMQLTKLSMKVNNEVRVASEWHHRRHIQSYPSVE